MVALPLQNTRGSHLHAASRVDFDAARCHRPKSGIQDRSQSVNLNAQRSDREPSPLASFLRQCNTMESPYYPTYSKRGASQPADDIGDLNRNTSIENLRELQKYSEKLHFETTCCRLWSEGIHTQIMDKQEKVQSWIAGMTEDLLRMKRIQPAWIQPVLSQGCPPAQQPAPYIPSQSASSSSASMAPVKLESFYGIRPTECSISFNGWCRSMG